MQINKLLRSQMSWYIKKDQVFSKELIDLLVIISSTYDYFEEKISQAQSACKDSAEPRVGQSCGMQ